MSFTQSPAGVTTTADFNGCSMYMYSRGGSGAGSLGGAQQLTGGGVVAEIFRDLQKPARFSGGGGSSRHFPYHISRNRPDSLARERYLPHIRSSPAMNR